MKSESINSEVAFSFPAHQRRLPVIIAGLDAEKRSSVCKSLGSISELRLDVQDGGESPGENKTIKASSIVLLILSEEERMWDEEVASWKRRHESSVIALLSKQSADAARRALHAGADEVVFLPLNAKQLVPTLVRISERNGAGGITRGFTVSFVSASGGTGTTSLALYLGFAMRRLTGMQVALVDLGFQTSALAALLDLEPEHCITELADPTSKIDSMRLESVLCNHESGLRLLASPKKIEDGELVSSSSVAATLDVLRELFDCVIVDCGHHINETSVVAWEHSDRVFYVLNQTITSICPARRFLELFDRLQLKEPHLALLLNRYSASNAISIEKIQDALHRPISICVGRDEKAFEGAELAGADLAVAAPGSEVVTEIDKLAHSLLGQPTNGQTIHFGVLNRLISMLRQ
jgi:pilus assembly protein CpaE